MATSNNVYKFKRDVEYDVESVSPEVKQELTESLQNAVEETLENSKVGIQEESVKQISSEVKDTVQSVVQTEVSNSVSKALEGNTEQIKEELYKHHETIKQDVKGINSSLTSAQASINAMARETAVANARATTATKHAILLVSAIVVAVVAIAVGGLYLFRDRMFNEESAGAAVSAEGISFQNAATAYLVSNAQPVLTDAVKNGDIDTMVQWTMSNLGDYMTYLGIDFDMSKLEGFDEDLKVTFDDLVSKGLISVGSNGDLTPLSKTRIASAILNELVKREPAMAQLRVPEFDVNGVIYSSDNDILSAMGLLATIDNTAEVVKDLPQAESITPELENLQSLISYTQVQLNQYTSKLTELQESMGNFKPEDIGSLQEQITSLKEDKQALDSFVAMQSSTIKDLQEKILGIPKTTTVVEKGETKVVDNSAELQSLGNTLSGLDSYYNTLKNSADSTQGQLDALAAKQTSDLSAVEATAQGLQSQADELRALVSTLNSSLDTSTSGWTAGDQKLSSEISTFKTEFTNQTAKTSKDIEALRSEMKKSDTDVNNLLKEKSEAFAADLSKNVKELTEKMNAADKELDTKLSNTDKTLNDKIDSTKNTLTSDLNTAKTELSTNLANTKTELSTNLENTKTELNDTITSVHNTMDTKLNAATAQLTARIQQLEDLVAANSAALANTESTIGDVLSIMITQSNELTATKLKDSFNQSMDDFITVLTQAESDIATYRAKSSTNATLEQEYDNALSEIAATKSLAASMKTVVTNKAAEIDEGILNTSINLVNLDDSAKEGLLNAVSKLKSLQNTVNVFTTQIRTSVQKVSDILNDLNMRSNAFALGVAMDDMNTDLTNSMTNMNNTLIEAISTTNQTFNEITDEIKDSIAAKTTIVRADNNGAGFTINTTDWKHDDVAGLGTVYYVDIKQSALTSTSKVDISYADSYGYNFHYTGVDGYTDRFRIYVWDAEGPVAQTINIDHIMIYTEGTAVAGDASIVE